ncbi:hypothetical protein PVL29_013958 [Vitis rotundifolia]|uniref:Mechanosensitive ion channel protein n=1 Tax=Vitis rotundifolia TaxID=103349 RepID=A0AA38ZG40_VITRO|nr:hypothetical protein PVL29_013958 [Vitis rotundifolia]
MESGSEASRKAGSSEDEVVVMISNSEESTAAKASAATEGGSNSFSKDSQASTELERLRSRVEMTPKTTPSSPDMARSPNASKPPKVPTESVVRRRSLGRSAYSKPKSRLLEPSCPIETSVEEKILLLPSSSPKTKSASPIHSRDNVKTGSATPQTPSVPGGEDEEEEAEEEFCKSLNSTETEEKSKKSRFVVCIEWIAFVCIMGCLIASITIHRLQHTMIWSLEIWKWSVLVLVIFCGRLVTEWGINIVVFMIEKNYLFRRKVLYFVFGLKKSMLVFIWLGLILLAWSLLIDGGVKRSRKTTRILNYVTRTLASCLAGAALWLAKALFVKMLATSFHVTRFFDRIQESFLHQHVLRTLEKPPTMKIVKQEGGENSAQMSLSQVKEKKEGVIDVGKIHKIKQEKVSGWTMKGMIDVISGSGLTTISNALDDSVDDEGGEHKEKEIADELEAKAAAIKIFANVAKPGAKYIDEEDLWHFMKKEEVDNLYLKSKPQHWSPSYSVLVKDIVNVNQMNMGLYVNHTINFQNYGNKNSRRSELVVELKKIFEDLNIKYHLLPQEVHLRSVDPAPPAFPSTMR